MDIDDGRDKCRSVWKPDIPIRLRIQLSRGTCHGWARDERLSAQGGHLLIASAHRRGTRAATADRASEACAIRSPGAAKAAHKYEGS